MLEQVFRKSAVPARIAANPIGPVLCRYVAYLVDRGHRASSLHQYTFAAEHFGRWLGHRPIDHAAVDHFIKRHLPRCQCAKPAVGNIACVRAALNRLLEMLGCQQAESGRRTAERLLQRYESHLRGVCGLSDTTTGYRLRYAGVLLRQRRIDRLGQLHAWSPALIAEYVSTVGHRCKPASGQVLACGIRSFLRFLLQEGLIRRDLASAVPSFANWRLAALPAVVTQTELEQLVAVVDPAKPIGMRDRAILLCMTELGLRAADVAAITVDGVDLASGILRLRRPKPRERVETPLTVRLGRALGLYLRRGRPLCDTNALFVIHRAPTGRGLTARGIGNIVARRAAQVGLATRIRGSNVIRHSVASTLINQGASLKQIADLLGHRSIDTTSIYAKVDLDSLAKVALPCPHTHKQEVRP